MPVADGTSVQSRRREGVASIYGNPASAFSRFIRHSFVSRAQISFDYRFSIVCGRFQCYRPRRLVRDLGPNARKRLLRGVEWLDGTSRH
jgi:hypothetical protein